MQLFRASQCSHALDRSQGTWGFDSQLYHSPCTYSSNQALEVWHERLQLAVSRVTCFKPLPLLSLYCSIFFVDVAVFDSSYATGEVIPHQDSTFLKTDPLSTLGFWIPLQVEQELVSGKRSNRSHPFFPVWQECTVSNGCLEVVPGSHKQGLINNFQMVRVTKDGQTETERAMDSRRQRFRACRDAKRISGLDSRRGKLF